MQFWGKRVGVALVTALVCGLAVSIAAPAAAQKKKGKSTQTEAVWRAGTVMPMRQDPSAFSATRQPKRLSPLKTNARISLGDPTVASVSASRFSISGRLICVCP